MENCCIWIKKIRLLENWRNFLRHNKKFIDANKNKDLRCSN